MAARRELPPALLLPPFPSCDCDMFTANLWSSSSCACLVVASKGCVSSVWCCCQYSMKLLDYD